MLSYQSRLNPTRVMQILMRIVVGHDVHSSPIMPLDLPLSFSPKVCLLCLTLLTHFDTLFRLWRLWPPTTTIMFVLRCEIVEGSRGLSWCSTTSVVAHHLLRFGCHHVSDHLLGRRGNWGYSWGGRCRSCRWFAGRLHTWISLVDAQACQLLRHR